MSSPVVVQGVPVGQAYPQQQQHHSGGHHSTGITKGEKQATSCRDPLFALLLYANVAIIIGIAATYGPGAMTADNNQQKTDYAGYVAGTAICAILSFICAGVGLAVLMCIPETLIKVSLIFVVALSGVWAVIALLSGSIFGGIMGVVFFALSVCYARAVWSRIPFASVNLVTACTAIRANLGVVLIAFIFTALAGVWSAIWTVAFVGVFDETSSCDAQTNVCNNPNYGYMFLLFVAYFFTHQVLQVSI
jgi:membrane-associated HD superfamily phosphohydrolase